MLPMLLFLLLQANSSLLDCLCQKGRTHNPTQAELGQLPQKMDFMEQDDQYRVTQKNITSDLALFLKHNLSCKRTIKLIECFKMEFLEMTITNYKSFSLKERRDIVLVMSIIINMTFDDVAYWKKQIENYKDSQVTLCAIIAALNESLKQDLGKYKLKRFVEFKNNEFTENLFFRAIEMALYFKLRVELYRVLGGSGDSYQNGAYIKFFETNFNHAIYLLNNLRLADQEMFNEVTGSFSALQQYLNENASYDLKTLQQFYLTRHFAVLNNLKYQTILLKYRPDVTGHAVQKMISNAENMKMPLYMILQSKSSMYRVYKEFFNLTLSQTLPCIGETNPFLKQLVCLHSIYSVYKKQEKLICDNFPEAIRRLNLRRIVVIKSQLGISTDIQELDACLSNLFSLFLLLEGMVEEHVNGDLNEYCDQVAELLRYIKQDISKIYERIDICPFIKLLPVLRVKIPQSHLNEWEEY